MERHRDQLSRLGGANVISKAPTNRKVRLTCQMCRQRKVKCDKKSPCTNCSRCGIDCEVVERPRLPRGKSQAPSSARGLEVQPDLQDRVKKLESIIRHLTEKEDAGGVTVAGTVGSDFASTAHSDPSSCRVENERSIDNLTTETAAVSRKSASVQFADKNDNGSEKYIGSSFWDDLSNQV